jgi:hypothetical protein
MWVLSSRSARGVTTAARASRSRRGPARRFCTNGSHGLVSDAIQTVRGRPTGPAELARGSSPLLVTARIAGSQLVRQEVHDTVGAVGRSGFLRTGHGRRFRSVGYPRGGEL